MHKDHEFCAQYGREGDRINYLRSANIGGFIKVAAAMFDYGVVRAWAYTSLRAGLLVWLLRIFR